jgi:hypothetical protein
MANWSKWMGRLELSRQYTVHSILLLAPELAAVGVPLSPAPGRADTLLLAPEVAAGARLLVCAADA